MDNVIQFPGFKKNSPPQSLEEINTNLENIKNIHVQETLALVIPMLFEQLAVAGFEFEEETSDVKSGALVVEAVRSMLLYKYDMYHPFQEISESIFKEESPGVFLVNKSINIDFKSTTTEEGKS